jgi:hypothetical protein
MKVRIAIGVSYLLLLASSGGSNSQIFFQRGVNLTAEFPDGYSSELSRGMVDQVMEYGVNAIALVPYGFTSRTEPVIRFGGNHSMESDEGIALLIQHAHERHVRVLLKPQLWMRGGYPGDLEFTKPEDIEKWFAQYRLFIEHYARLATSTHSDMLCVGVEFVKLCKYEARWRSIIQRVRQLYSGPLVYAANFGPEFETVQFWDALDYIGLNNYYALPDDLSTDAIVAKVEAVHRKFQKPVIFPEAGFSSYESPHRQPWDDTGHRLAPKDQARCYEAVLKAFYKKPWFQGMYWWKVGTNGYGGLEDGSHTPWKKPAMEVVKKWYLAGGR